MVEDQAVHLNVAFERHRKIVELGMGVPVVSVDFDFTNDCGVSNDVDMQRGQLLGDGDMTLSL